MADLPLYLGAFVAVLAATIGGYWSLAPLLTPADPLRRRMDRLAAASASSGTSGRRDGGSGRTSSVKETLAEIEETQRKRSRMSLRLKLRQAGLNWSRGKFAGFSAAFGIAVAAALLVLGLGPLPTLGFALAAALGGPEFFLRFQRRRRLKLMSAEFPNAVDVIVRGVKSGLPFADCLRIIANESAEPLRSEFAKIVRDQTIGLPTAEAVQRFADRVPLAEANFFAIVITIQSRTGGSLSGSLSNLSTVLRERKKMRGKIKAMSAEAKASAGIIGSLPVGVGFLVYLTSPDYIMLLFNTLIGNVVIGGCLLWMGIGVLVMRNMINFEI